MQGKIYWENWQMYWIKVKLIQGLQIYSSCQTTIWLRTFSSYCEPVEHFCFFETFFHWGLVSPVGITWVQLFQGTLESQTKTTVGLSFVSWSLLIHQKTGSRPQCRHQSHQRTKSFQIGSNVLLFKVSAHLIVYVGFIIAWHLCIIF